MNDKLLNYIRQQVSWKTIEMKGKRVNITKARVNIYNAFDDLQELTTALLSLFSNGQQVRPGAKLIKNKRKLQRARK